jgi:hypothetical protein
MEKKERLIKVLTKNKQIQKKIREISRKKRNNKRKEQNLDKKTDCIFSEKCQQKCLKDQKGRKTFLTG